MSTCLSYVIHKLFIIQDIIHKLFIKLKFRAAEEKEEDGDMFRCNVCTKYHATIISYPESVSTAAFLLGAISTSRSLLKKKKGEANKVLA